MGDRENIEMDKTETKFKRLRAKKTDSRSTWFVLVVRMETSVQSYQNLTKEETVREN